MLASFDAPDRPGAEAAGAVAAAELIESDRASSWASQQWLPACEWAGDRSLREANAALAQWLGWPLAEFKCQPVEIWLPWADHLPSVSGPEDRSMLNRAGQRLWARWHTAPDRQGGLRCLVQDCTEEYRLRVEAERLRAEQRLWFGLSPSGKVVYDDQGLILQANAVFEHWVCGKPVTLADVPAPIQELLGWRNGRLRPELSPGKPPLDTQVHFEARQDRDGEGTPVLLRARLMAFATEDGDLRTMAVIGDASHDALQELAELRQAALLHATRADVVRLEAVGPGEAGSLLGTQGGPAEDPARAGTVAGLQVAEQERLRSAWRRGLPGEVRYALDHPQRGPRRYLTQVLPARLRNGTVGATLVTLDVTDQEREREQREELLRELTTILDGSPVGIAYLRHGRLVRCNLRFEHMLGFSAGAAAGLALAELLELRGLGNPGVDQALAALGDSRPSNVELALPELDAHGQPNGGLNWYALSIRPSASNQGGPEAVVVLNDITRQHEQQSDVERALRERELMFNQADVAIAWVRKGRVVRANPALSEMTGLRPAELADKPLETLFLASVDSPLHADAQMGLSLRGRHSGEYRLLTRGGQPRWAQVSLRLADSRNPQSDLICSMVDVDERQRARESLQQLAGRTRAVLDSVLVGIVTLGEHGIEWMNRSARRMFGGELQDFIGQSLGCVASGEPDHPLARTDWLQCLADGDSENFECRLQARDGRAFWVVGNAVATPREAASGRQITFALLDIEARRQAEVRITGAKASLQRLIETAPLAIAVFDAASLQIVECNQSAAGFFGKSVRELMGRTPEDGLAGHEQAAVLRASLELACQTPEGVRREITHAALTGNATQRWDTRFVHLSAPQTAAGPTGAGQILLLANDVTELRMAEQARLDAAIAQREMLVREVHHRIKNNLQGVAGLLQQTAQRRPEMREALLEAIGQVQAIAQVYGLQVGAGGPLELLGVLRAVAGTVQRSLSAVIEVSLAAGPPPMTATEMRQRWMLPESESIPLALSLNELLINAARHGGCAGGAGAVRCTVHASSTEVRIEILNPGRLPPGFELKPGPSTMHGLGLVRALLPRRAATLEMGDGEAGVLTRLTLRPPSVQLTGPQWTPAP